MAILFFLRQKMRGKRLMKQTDGADSQLYSGELKSKSFASICSDQTSNKENKEQQLHQSSTGTENNLSLQERTANSPSIQPPSMVRFELTTAQLMNDRKRRKRSSFSLRGKRKSSFGEMQSREDIL
jgi:Fe-S cluster biosynthesis and repair protein YggX